MKTLLMSDLHIGFKYSRVQDILQVLNHESFDRLVLVGDIFDIQQMMKRPYWDEHHTAALKKILKLAKNKEVIYVIGNHDFPLLHINNEKVRGINFVREYVYDSGETKILCIHGDQMDRVANHIAVVGDALYYIGLRLNKYINIVRKQLGLPYWSLSKWGKDKAKNLIHKTFNMTNEIHKFKEKHSADVLVYGHTHMPYVKEGIVNTGTFVEIATYVTEENGKFTLHNLDLFCG